MIEEIFNAYPDDEFLKADGLDEAIIGVEDLSKRLIYSYKKIIEILCLEMSLEDAREHFDFNIGSAYV